MRHGDTDSHSYVGSSIMVPSELYLSCRLQWNEFHGPIVIVELSVAIVSIEAPLLIHVAVEPTRGFENSSC